MLIAIAALCGLAWAYTLSLATTMPASSVGPMPVMAMAGTPNLQGWALSDFVTMLAMWSIMMVAMMLPSATPMILLFANLTRTQGLSSTAWLRIGLFVSGYVVVWASFSVVATTVNWGLHTEALLTSMMGRTTPVIGGIILVCAGVYQWTSLKYACLAHCRSPIGFLTTHWRGTTAAAFEIGVRHGAYCLGCCWALMFLLFTLGVMNLVWIAALTVFVLLEKVVPRGHMVGRAAGLGMMSWGVWLTLANAYA